MTIFVSNKAMLTINASGYWFVFVPKIYSSSDFFLCTLI